MVARTVLHINVVNFHVSIARVIEPKLRSYPVAVVTSGSSRRILIDVSAEARDAGVHKGMQIEEAKRCCRDLVVVNQAPRETEKAGIVLMRQAEQLSPLAEPAGPGHVFVDLTGTRRLLGPAVDVADRLRKMIRSELLVDATVGLATNRLVSKIATRVIKPRGLCSVIEGCEEEFMAPLPVTFLPGLEDRLLSQLLQFNLHMIRDLVAIAPATLATALGPVAWDIWKSAQGIDPTPVRPIGLPPPTIKESVTLEEQTNDEQLVACALFHLVAKAAAQVRKMGLAASRLKVGIAYADGDSVARTVRLAIPLRGDLSLFEPAKAVLRKLFTRRIRLTDLLLELSDLTFPYGQTDLFLDTEKEEHLMSAIDSIRTSFGHKAISFWGREVA